MQLGEPMSTGRYRTCHEIPGTTLCAKKMRPLQWSIRSLVCCVLRDINQEEIDVFQRLPKNLQVYFPNKYEKQGELLISERPMDFNGSFSKPLIEYNSINNVSFWESIDTITELMIEYKIWLFDVFHTGDNILVQKTSRDVYKPVIIDCKRLGWGSYPLQINLLLDSEKEKKLRRRLDKFKQNFQKEV